MSNFGFLHLRVVKPFEVAFREARSAVGAGEVLARAEEFDTVAGAVADCKLVVGTTSASRRDPQQPLQRLDFAGPDLRRHLQHAPMALLFGSEKVGLSNADLSHCHWLLQIPTRDEHASMNLGQAVAVCLYELARATQPGEKFDVPTKASAETEEMITSVLADSLRYSGYIDPKGAETAEKKTRRLVRRLSLSAADAEVWLGMLRQILWKLRRDSTS